MAPPPTFREAVMTACAETTRRNPLSRAAVEREVQALRVEAGGGSVDWRAQHGALLRRALRQLVGEGLLEMCRRSYALTPRGRFEHRSSSQRRSAVQGGEELGTSRLRRCDHCGALESAWTKTPEPKRRHHHRGSSSVRVRALPPAPPAAAAEEEGSVDEEPADEGEEEEAVEARWIWQFQEDGEEGDDAVWRTMSAETCGRLEEAMRDGVHVATLADVTDEFSYAFDLENMIQRNVTHPNHRARHIRRVLQTDSSE